MSLAGKIGQRSPDSSAMLPYWEQVGDIVKGKDAITGRSTAYLPKYPKEEQTDYDSRLQFNKFTNIYRDVVENLASKPFEQEITLPDAGETKPPESIRDFIEDVDGSGNNLTIFGSEAFFNGINATAHWVLIDYPTTDTTRVRTRDEEKKLGIRPFWSHILAQNVLDAVSKVINGKEEWVYIEILEPGTADIIRVFRRADSLVTWETYKQNVETKEWIPQEVGTVSIGVIPMVLFYTGRRDGKRYYFYPLMRDAADLQIDLYQQESALKYAKHLTAFPMLAGNGIRPQMDTDGKTPLKIGIGPGRVLYSSPDGKGNSGTWTFIEPNAASLKFLSEDIKETIQQLRELGRQPLTAQSGNLTTITTAVAAGKARSAVAACAIRLKDALENALVITSLWLSQSEYKPEVKVYTDFDDFSDTASNIDALVTMRENGDISQLTYWDEMKRYKVLSPEFEAEDEIKRILAEVPSDPTDENLDDDGNVIPPKPKEPNT